MKEQNIITYDHEEADYILAVADRIETFDFVLDKFRENIPIIHLFAGEISQGTHDEVYRHAMTLMSELQLCSHEKAKERVEMLCDAVDKKPNAYVVGNLFLDDLTIDKSLVPDFKYDLILYNPPTRLGLSGVTEDIREILSIIKKPFFWIEPNGDIYSDKIMKYVNTHTLPRPQFLGLLKNCRRFITNSSCQYYEAPLFIKQEQIIPIGMRNINRECKYSDIDIPNATNNILEVLNTL